MLAREGDPLSAEQIDQQLALAVNRDYEAALEQAMAILQQDRSYRDDLGRTTMIRIFTLLGKGSDLATSYRRRMFNFMH